jgi:hypothetical protein
VRFFPLTSKGEGTWLPSPLWGEGLGVRGLLLLVLIRPVVVIVPLVVKVTVRGKIRFVGEKFFMVNALKIFNHVKQYANQKN